MSSSTGRTPTKRRSRRQLKGALTGWDFLAPFAILFTVVFLIPIIVPVVNSVYQKRPGKGGLYGGGEPVTVFVGFANYLEVLGTSDSGLGWLGWLAMQPSKSP